MELPRVPGQPIWVDLYTSDPDAAQVFYGKLFGWTAEESGPEYGGYLTFRHATGPVAGCMLNDGSAGGVNSWSVYLESKDAAATVSMAEANGGRLAVEAMQVGDLGHMAFVTDPADAMIGIWQPGTHTGFSTERAVGTPVWFELLTGDYETAVPFYQNVFGWVTDTMSDTEEFRYTTLGKGDDAVAGIMDASGFLGEAPSAWSMYVEVEDSDETVRLAEEAGGVIVMPPDDSPYGRLAELADPTGARFKILGPNLESA